MLTKKKQNKAVKKKSAELITKEKRPKTGFVKKTASKPKAVNTARKTIIQQARPKIATDKIPIAQGASALIPIAVKKDEKAQAGDSLLKDAGALINNNPKAEIVLKSIEESENEINKNIQAKPNEIASIFKSGQLINKESVVVADKIKDSEGNFPLIKTRAFGWQSDKAQTSDVEQKKETEKTSRPITIYRTIAYFFSIATVALIAVVFYFSFFKAVIIITPAEERINGNLIIDIFDNSNNIAESGSLISGAVKEVEIELAGLYPATGSEIIGKEVTGKVTLINNYDRSQMLVATTRLLSSDNKLFRLKSTVTVPAGGALEVEVYADEPSHETAIGPAVFKIPGLWAGLQDKIYAENKEAMTYSEQVKKTVLQSDLDQAEDDLKQKLIEKAKTEISDNDKEYNKILYQIDEDSIIGKINAEAGEEKEEFSAAIKAKIAVITFDDEKVYQLAKKKIAAMIPDDKKLIAFNKSDISFILNNCNTEQAIASVDSSFAATASADGNKIINKEKIVGLNKEQLESYLSGLRQIAAYEIKFYPSFIKKVPNLVDRIEILIK